MGHMQAHQRLHCLLNMLPLSIQYTLMDIIYKLIMQVHASMEQTIMVVARLIPTVTFLTQHIMHQELLLMIIFIKMESTTRKVVHLEQSEEGLPLLETK